MTARAAGATRPARAARTASASRAGRRTHRSRAPQQRQLYQAADHGRPVPLRPEDFIPPQRDGGWGQYAEAFVRLNQASLTALDVQVEMAPGPGGAAIRLVPGGSAGAVPLRSAQTGHVASGFIVKPRFGWAGTGRVLSETGWAASPRFLDLPLVPGSGREIPPWVLAGPVLMRLQALLGSLRRAYREEEAVLQHPRGRILWPRYLNESMVRGRWERLPCRFPDLGHDPRFRSHVRWVLERIRADLVAAGGTDPVATALAALAVRLIEHFADVVPLPPSREDLRRRSLSLGSTGLEAEALRRGVEAMAWVVEERGLGGGRELDGLAWALPLDRLWEAYVEAVYRREAALTGGEVRVGRLGQTTFPLDWSDPTHRSLGHLVPDIVIRRGRAVQVVDAKYKAHLAELDEVGWARFAEDAREAHRADLHQVLAYASLYDAERITATLVYPLRRRTWEALDRAGRSVARATLLHGGRSVELELRGLPFGAPRTATGFVDIREA